MKKKVFILLFPAIAVLLELLPCGVTMRFAAPPGEPPFLTQTSYFNLLPMGYGNFAPLATGVLTVVLLLLLLLYLAKGKLKLWKAGKTISLLGAILSFFPLFFAAYTVIGGMISVCLFAEYLLLALSKPTEETN